MIDQLMIKQKVEMLEAVAGVMGYGLETSNKYRIKNVLGQVSMLLLLLWQHQDTSLCLLEHLQGCGGH